MNAWGDDAVEITTTTDEAIERLLRGRIPSAGAPGDALGSFVAAVRLAGAQPATPSPSLAALLVSGTSPEAGVPAWVADLAGPAPHLTGERKTWRGRAAARVTLGRLLARLAGLGAVARTIAALAAVTAGIAIAGAAGALPAAAQAQFDEVVQTVIPGGHPAKPAIPSTDGNEFGKSVSEDAKDGGVDGGEISERAKQNGNRPDGAGSPTAAPSKQVGKPAVPGPPSPPAGLSNRPSPSPKPHPTGPPTPG